MRTDNTILDLYAIIVIVVLLVSCIVQRRLNKKISIYLIGWMIVHMLMLCCDVARWKFRGKIEALSLFTVMFILEFVLGYICLCFFHYYFIDYMKEYVEINLRWRLIVWPVTIIMSGLWVLSRYNRMFYVITYNAVNVPNKGYYLSQLPAMLVIMLDMFFVFWHRHKIGWRNVLVMWLYMIFSIDCISPAVCMGRRGIVYWHVIITADTICLYQFRTEQITC